MAGDISSSRHPSSPIHPAIGPSSSPPLPTIITPHSPEHDIDSEPIEWPSSPPPERRKFELVEDEKPAAKTSLDPETVVELDLANDFPFDEIPDDFVDVRTPDIPPPISRPTITLPIPDQSGNNIGLLQVEAEPMEEDAASTLDKDSNEASTLDKDPDEARLEDLFGDDNDDAGPSNHAKTSVTADMYDLTNDQDDYDDFDDFPYPDLETFNTAGPSTTPLRPLTENAPRFYSSPPNRPPVAHPIMLISDLPEEDQEFYNNHWRRGADKVRKVAAQVSSHVSTHVLC